MLHKLVAAVALSGAILGVSRAEAPAFEVASIKPSAEVTPEMVASGKIHAGMRIDAARVDIGLTSLLDLICKAYAVKEYQVDAPDWMKGLKAPRFDIVAKMPSGATKEQVPEMLKALLAERFKLTIHRESKEQKVFALVAGKNGPQLKEAAPDPQPADPAAPGSGAPNSSSGSSQMAIKTTANGAVMSDGKGAQTTMTWSADHKSLHLETSRMTMDELAGTVTGYQDRPVVDMTGLKGSFQVALDLSMEDMMNAARRAGMALPSASGGGDAGRPAEIADDPGDDSMRRSLRALGLKLEPRKMALERIVVDRAEKTPTEN